MITIAFTGHRPNKLGNDYDLVSPKVKLIETQIYNTVTEIAKEDEYEFIVGGALGIDTLVAKLAIKFYIPFTVAVPCRDQDRMWPQKSRDRYKDILLKAKEIYYISEEYNNHCMQDRNKWMVDNSDILIAVWNGTKGGTANCINYAQKIGKRVIIIKI